MAAPTPYALAYDFTSFQASNPTTPLPADKVEIEFNAIQTTTDEIITNLGLIQRSDGEIANNVIGVDQLKAEVSFGLNSVSTWVTGTNYVANDGVYGTTSTYNGIIYRCLVAHQAGVFATDLAANKWSVLVDHKQFLDVTAADAVSTAADAVSTAADAVSTAADAVSTAADSSSAAASAAAAASSAAEGLYNNVVTLTNADSPYVPSLSEEGTLFRLDMTSGAITINLSALSVYAEDMKFGFVKVDAGGNSATINRGGSDTISGNTSLTLSTQFETHVIIGDSATATWIDTVQTTGIEDGSVTLAKLADIPTSSLFYRKTAGSGPPETQTLSTLKVDLGLTGTNTGDQTLTPKVGNLSRDLTAASGSQAVTGVGFQPSAILFFGAVNSGSAMSIGGGNAAAMGMIRDITGGNHAVNSIQAMGFVTSAGNQQSAVIASLDSDGFTLTWTKAGSPTGTAVINYIAFR